VGGTLDITLPEIPDIIGRPQAHILALSWQWGSNKDSRIS
jgi:hypothetical protein